MRKRKTQSIFSHIADSQNCNIGQREAAKTRSYKTNKMDNLFVICLPAYCSEPSNKLAQTIHEM